jgi:hypothetical protein
MSVFWAFFKSDWLLGWLQPVSMNSAKKIPASRLKNLPFFLFIM